MTEQIKLNIYQRLLSCMSDLRYLQKDESIKSGNVSYKVISHDKVTAACTEVFIRHGIYPRLQIIKEGLELVTIKRYDSYNKKDVEVTEYMATVQAVYELINVDDPSEKVVINAFGQGQDNRDKAFGKAISYACKYALLKGLGIETGDDPDKDADNAMQPQNIKPKTPAVKQHVNQQTGEVTDTKYLIDGFPLDAPALYKTIKKCLEAAKGKDKVGEFVYYTDWAAANADEIQRFNEDNPKHSVQLNELYNLISAQFEGK